LQFFLADWTWPRVDNVAHMLGLIRAELGLPEAMIARSDGGGLLFLASPDPELSEQRVADALRRAIHSSAGSRQQLSVLRDIDACNTFLVHATGLAEPNASIEEGYLASLNARAVGDSIARLFSAGLSLRRAAAPYLALKGRDRSREAFVLELVRKIFGDLSEIRIYLLGCHPDAVAIAARISRHARVNILVTSTNSEGCIEVARTLPGKYSPPELAPDKVAAADLVICSETKCCQPLKTLHFAIACSRRNDLPLVILDLSEERCIDIAIARLDGVILYDRLTLQSELSARCNSWAQELARIAGSTYDAARDFVAQIQINSADKLSEALHSFGDRIARRELVKLQPTLDRFRTRERKAVVDAVTRAARGAASAMADAAGKTSSRADLADALKQAIEDLSEAHHPGGPSPSKQN